MNKKLVIIGAGGHAKVCYEIAQKMKLWTDFIFLDDNLENDFFAIAGPIKDYIKYPTCDFFIAIGSNTQRKKLVLELKVEGLPLVTLIHPHATISKTVRIAEGSVVMAGAVIDADAHIGQGCIINSGCLIAHDVWIDSYVHISPGANLAGTVSIGELSWIGASATVINNLIICSNVILGAGATAVKDIIEPGTYIGLPAKKI